jgi:hypothetical protein
MAAAERAGARDVRADDGEASFSMVVDDPDAGTPGIVRALVAAGASIREACDDRPPLEDVYVRLLERTSGAWLPPAGGTSR